MTTPPTELVYGQFHYKCVCAVECLRMHVAQCRVRRASPLAACVSVLRKSFLPRKEVTFSCASAETWVCCYSASVLGQWLVWNSLLCIPSFSSRNPGAMPTEQRGVAA